MPLLDSPSKVVLDLRKSKSMNVYSISQEENKKHEQSPIDIDCMMLNEDNINDDVSEIH
jgi:hypothetical protein